MQLSLSPRTVVSFMSLALGLLTVRASAQSPETPFFAEDLTRTKLGPISGLDEQIASQARMAPDGHMMITGAETDVLVSAGKFITLHPNLNIPGFTAVTLAVFEDGQRTKVFGTEKVPGIPIIPVEPPTGAVNRKVVQIVAYDALSKPRLLMKCIVRTRVGNPLPASLNYQSDNEKCALKIANRSSLQTGYLYLGEIYMGCVGDNTEKLQMDERRLPPGKYTCQMVAQNTDGIFLPGLRTEFEVPTRYTITCEDKSQTIKIPAGATDSKLKVTVKHAPGIGIVSTRVYIAGILAGEKEGDSFTMNLPLKEVPTGINPIEVIGVAKDESTYPVESIAVDIKNEPWETETCSKPEYQKIRKNIPIIKQLQVDVAYWLTKAANSSSVDWTGTTVTNDSISFTFAPGKYADYKAKAAEKFKLLVQLQLETGLLYRDLKMRTAAKSYLYRVVQEVGNRKDEGRDAQNALDKLRKERSTSL